MNRELPYLFTEEVSHKFREISILRCLRTCQVPPKKNAVNFAEKTQSLVERVFQLYLTTWTKAQVQVECQISSCAVPSRMLGDSV
jgi:hypothetical protein